MEQGRWKPTRPSLWITAGSHPPRQHTPFWHQSSAVLTASTVEGKLFPLLSPAMTSVTRRRLHSFRAPSKTCNWRVSITLLQHLHSSASPAVSPSLLWSPLCKAPTFLTGMRCFQGTRTQERHEFAYNNTTPAMNSVLERK